VRSLPQYHGEAIEGREEGGCGRALLLGLRVGESVVDHRYVARILDSLRQEERIRCRVLDEPG